MIRSQNDTNIDAQKAEEVVLEDSRLADAVLIFHEKDLILGVTVKTFSRFHKQKIEKELQGKLEEAYPDLDVTVSADRKIIQEAAKLLGEKEDEKLRKKIKKLKSLLEEET